MILMTMVVVVVVVVVVKVAVMMMTSRAKPERYLSLVWAGLITPSSNGQLNISKSIWTLPSKLNYRGRSC